MNYEEFKNVVHHRFSKCEDLLTSKSFEYAPNKDRLEQFKITAKIQGCSSIRSLGGMMVKHTSTLHQFMNEPEKYNREQWEERISDIINYCLLLEGLLEETWRDKEYMEAATGHVTTANDAIKYYPSKTAPKIVETEDTSDIKFHTENSNWEPTCR